MADSLVGRIGRFQWGIAVTRIGQLASEMRLTSGGQSVGGSNGNADELTGTVLRNEDLVYKWII